MATSNVRINERRNTTYKQGDTLQFYIDGSTVPMLDPTNTFIRCNLVIGQKGVQTTPAYAVGDEAVTSHMFPYTLNPKIGGESLVKQLTIKTMDDTILEQVQAANVLCRVLANTTQNDVMNNLKRLYGGADTMQVRELNTLSERTQNNDANTQNNKEIEVLIPLSVSGILGGKNREPVPIAALGGLIVEVLLEDDVWKCVRFQGDTPMSDPQGVEFRDDKDEQNKVLGYEAASAYAIQALSPALDSNAVVTFTLQNAADAPAGATRTIANVSTNQLALQTPFYNGQTIVIGASTGNIEAVVSKIDSAGGRLRVTIPATDFTGNTTAQPSVHVKYDAAGVGKPDLNLSNVELICGVADASGKQLEALGRAVSGGGGYQYSYPSFGHFGVNLSANSLRTSSYIPANYRQAVMILSAWENISEATSPLKDNLCPPLDTSTKPLSYNFIINNLLVPTREVDLSRYNNNRTQPGGFSQVHIKQLTDALHCGGYVTRDLSDVDGCLAIGQCLAPRPHTFDMSGSEGETRININFDGTQTRSLLLHNFVHHIKTLVIKPNQKMVLE